MLTRVTLPAIASRRVRRHQVRSSRALEKALAQQHEAINVLAQQNADEDNMHVLAQQDEDHINMHVLAQKDAGEDNTPIRHEDNTPIRHDQHEDMHTKAREDITRRKKRGPMIIVVGSSLDVVWRRAKLDNTTSFLMRRAKLRMRRASVPRGSPAEQATVLEGKGTGKNLLLLGREKSQNQDRLRKGPLRRRNISRVVQLSRRVKSPPQHQRHTPGSRPR